MSESDKAKINKFQNKAELKILLVYHGSQMNKRHFNESIMKTDAGIICYKATEYKLLKT